MDSFLPPAQATFWLVEGRVLFWFLHLLGIACFLYIVGRRMVPLLRAAPDVRFDRPMQRLGILAKFWLAQWKHPRYRFAGTIHILVFAGFLLLATRAFTVLILGIDEGFVWPGLSGRAGQAYAVVAQYMATVVFVCMIVAAIRRLVFKPARYTLPPDASRRRHFDTIFLLALIAALMLADAVFESTEAAAHAQLGLHAAYMAPGSMAWMAEKTLAGAPVPALHRLHLGAYLSHELLFFFLLCYRPFGIQFHVETSLFSVYFGKLDKGTVKPVRWGQTEEQLAQAKSLGVKTFEDFTWKHMLDFYSCADCGRCSDNCPANAVGRPLSPRFITTKARDYSYQHYPMLGAMGNGTPLVGSIYSDDEIWSCTTCGACEEECPLLIEYIDKIVDLRRGMVDGGNVPQSLQKPLKALESRGNPYGKMEKKRAEWAKAKDFKQTCEVRTLDGSAPADTLYFVDSITSFDDRMQSIGRATARILDHVGENFGILGPAEKDSGHEVRRFGEEMLFMALRDHNVEAIRQSGVKRIVTADPHAFNALRHDYRDMPPVEHISQVVARAVKTGRLQFKPLAGEKHTYAYHDPCYLGRHNQVYDEPRAVLDAVPGLKRVEMQRCRDRSFCCGGGGLMLFYEPKEDQRMGVLRVKMAAEAGADVLVTACPFCMVNIEDAIKVAGLEGRMTSVDLAELVDQQIVRATPQAPAAKPGETRETELVM